MTPFKHFVSGLAPLVSGLLLVSIIAVSWLGIPPLQELAAQTAEIAPDVIIAQASQLTFWLGIYLAFAITSEMLPSSSDRRYWLPLALILLGMVALTLLTRTAGWLISNLYPYVNNWLKVIGVVFFISLVPHLLLWLPLRLVRLLVRTR